MSEPLQISVHVDEKRYQPTQEKTVIPGWDAKTVTPDKGYALSKVTINGMPEPTDSETFTENGTYDVGRIGTAIVDVDVDLQDKTVTPTEQTQTVDADTGYDGLDRVTVNPIPSEYVIPTGTVDITVNGQVSVAGKATANVNVPGIIPTGTKQISIRTNGTTTEDVSEYADAEITVNTDPVKGLVFENYDSDGYPHSARFVGMTIIPDYYCGANNQGIFASSNCYKYIKTLYLPDQITKIEQSAFRNNDGLNKVSFPPNLEYIKNNAFYMMYNLEEIEFRGDIDQIYNNAFFIYQHIAKLKRVDFSHCTKIPILGGSNAFICAPDCVMPIPAALSDTTLGEGNGWESATNWSALTNIVWEVV